MFKEKHVPYHTKLSPLLRRALLPSVPGGAGVVSQQLQDLPRVADGPVRQQKKQSGMAPVDGLPNDPLQRR